MSAPAEEVPLTIGEVAAMVGMSTDAIRAWERRHRVLSPRRTVTHHRRYTMEDVETLRRVRHNVSARGLSLKLAVAEAHGVILEEVDGPPRRDVAVTAVPNGHDAPWRAVADLLPNVLCILDGAGHIVDANIAFAHMAGVLRPQLKGLRLLNLVEAADRAKAARLYRPRPQPRRGWELNIRTRTLSGIFAFDSYVVPTATSALIVLVGRDLSTAGLEMWPQHPAPHTTTLSPR